MRIELPFLSGRTPNGNPVIGEQSQQLIDQLHAQYQTPVARGNTYVFSTAPAGIALLVPATTGGHPTLWNPKGSGVNLSILQINLSYASGTDAPTALELAYTLKAGADIGPTGAAILTATKVAGLNALLGAPVNHKAIWSPAVNTFTAAPVGYYALGAGLRTGAAATALNETVMQFPINGMLGIAPDNAVSLCSVAATTTALYMVTFVVEEVPITPFQQNA